MSREILSLDFYNNEIVAVLASWEEQTDKICLSHAARFTCPGLVSAQLADAARTQEELKRIWKEISSHFQTDKPEVYIGLRGSFLSFKRSSGFEAISSRNRAVTKTEITAALHNSIPTRLEEDTNVVDVLPQIYTIDGQTDIAQPLGRVGFTLEVETLLTLAPTAYVNTLTDALHACGCDKFKVFSSAICMADVLLHPAEKQAGALLVDVGQNTTSVAMYYKGMLVAAWELDIAQRQVTAAVADVLQNDLQTAQEVLQTYRPGTDEIIDDTLAQAQEKLYQSLHQKLLYTSIYLQHPPMQLILCGTHATKERLKICKKIFRARKLRLVSAKDVVSGPVREAEYTGGICITAHALARENNTVGTELEKPSGLLNNLLDKLGWDWF